MSFVDIFSPLAVLRRPSRTPFRVFSNPLEFLRGPPSRPLADPSRASSNAFVALRGNLFAFSWKSFPPSRPLADPSRGSSNAFVALRRSSWPFVEIFLPFPGNLFPPSRPSANPYRSISNPLVALRGPSCPFVDIFCLSLEIFSPCPTLGGSLSSLLQPLRGPSWISFYLFVEILSPLGDLWRIPLEPPPTPSWPFAVLRGNLFAFSWKSFPPSRPLADPSRASSNAFVALRGYLFTFSWKSFLPLATFGGSLSSLLQRLRGPSPFFVALRGNLFAFPFSPFVEIFLPFPSSSSFPFVDNSFPLRALRGSPSWMISITFHHFKPPRGLSPICARIPLKRRLIPQVRAFAPAPLPFPFGRRAPAG